MFWTKEEVGRDAFGAESVSVASPIHPAPFSHYKTWAPTFIETGNLRGRSHRAP